jgi:hypothetical protein
VRGQLAAEQSRCFKLEVCISWLGKTFSLYPNSSVKNIVKKFLTGRTILLVASAFNPI